MERLETPPAPPKGLSEGARREWAGLAATATSLGVLTGADLRALALLAETLATEARLRDVIARDGETIRGANNNKKAHPALRALADSRAQAMRLLASFGMTPIGRQAVEPARLKKVNRFAQLAANTNQENL